jgi:alanine dehydrogenase
MRADVTIYDISNARLAELDMFFGSQIKTAYASKAAIAEAVAKAEPGDRRGAGARRGGAQARHPRHAQDDDARLGAGRHRDRPGRLLRDLAGDHPRDPVYEVDGVIHYCVANMPGAVARTSAFALNNATLPFALKLAKALSGDESRSAPRQRPQRLGRQDPPPGGGRGARPAVRAGLS